MKEKKARRRVTKALLREWGLRWLAEFGYEDVSWVDASFRGFFAKWHETSRDRIAEVMFQHGLLKSDQKLFAYMLNKDELNELLK